MNLNSHISSISKTVFYHANNLSSHKHFLNEKKCSTWIYCIPNLKPRYGHRAGSPAGKVSQHYCTRAYIIIQFIQQWLLSTYYQWKSSTDIITNRRVAMAVSYDEVYHRVDPQHLHAVINPMSNIPCRA